MKAVSRSRRSRWVTRQQVGTSRQARLASGRRCAGLPTRATDALVVVRVLVIDVVAEFVGFGIRVC